MAAHFVVKHSFVSWLNDDARTCIYKRTGNHPAEVFEATFASEAVRGGAAAHPGAPVYPSTPPLWCSLVLSCWVSRGSSRCARARLRRVGWRLRHYG